MKKRQLLYEIIAIILSAVSIILFLMAKNAKPGADSTGNLYNLFKLATSFGISGMIIGSTSMMKKEEFSILGVISILFGAIAVAFCGIKII